MNEYLGDVRLSVQYVKGFWERGSISLTEGTEALRFLLCHRRTQTDTDGVGLSPASPSTGFRVARALRGTENLI